ncbi:hypothetical protein [Streptomyces sp. SP18CS02]|uniref:hypothetical protein n=1 Tax=Streptomyces sp. SP18CS02 TaxID=3002531 RepID=UPI002E796AD2|nr:hypothetical protein [Streptomyces sp. SP18CS02]MEE1752805.1 hypothetical protein [Streptomyces sp. SP18CS02]
MKDVTNACLAQVHPDHSGLVDEVIDWYDGVTVGLDRTVMPSAADVFALKRWAAHGYETDPASLGDTGSWTQLNVRDLEDVEQPVLPDGFRFRTADEAGPRAVVQAHVDAWSPSAFTAEGYEGVRRTPPYRGDLHVLVEAPDVRRKLAGSARPVERALLYCSYGGSEAVHSGSDRALPGGAGRHVRGGRQCAVDGG